MKMKKFYSSVGTLVKFSIFEIPYGKFLYFEIPIGKFFL